MVLLGLKYRFEVTPLFLGWLALMISGVLLALVFRRDPLQTRATDHEGEEGERQSHRQETDKHKQRLLPLCCRVTRVSGCVSLRVKPGPAGFVVKR